MARVFAIANQKGGVAKTTTTQTVGLALADLGERVLLVDLDPQACLTFALGLEPERARRRCTTCSSNGSRPPTRSSTRDACSLLPANIDLAGSEVHLLTRTGREHDARPRARPVRDSFDTVLIDCPPSLGVLTVNGLTAADEVLVPLQCEALSHRGVAQLLETIADVREFTNPRLRVRGVIATMFDARGRHAREVLDDVQNAVRAHRARPADPEDRSVRRSARPRGLDPRARAAARPARRPTARSPRCCTTIPQRRRERLPARVGHRPDDRARPDGQGRAVLRTGRPARPAPPTALGQAARSADVRRPGTVVVECGACGESTRVSYVDFALAQPAVLGVAAAAAGAPRSTGA